MHKMKRTAQGRSDRWSVDRLPRGLRGHERVRAAFAGRDAESRCNPKYVTPLVIPAGDEQRRGCGQL